MSASPPFLAIRRHFTPFAYPPVTDVAIAYLLRSCPASPPSFSVAAIFLVNSALSPCPTPLFLNGGLRASTTDFGHFHTSTGTWHLPTPRLPTLLLPTLQLPTGDTSVGDTSTFDSRLLPLVFPHIVPHLPITVNRYSCSFVTRLSSIVTLPLSIATTHWSSASPSRPLSNVARNSPLVSFTSALGPRSS